MSTYEAPVVIELGSIADFTQGSNNGRGSDGTRNRSGNSGHGDGPITS